MAAMSSHADDGTSDSSVSWQQIYSLNVTELSDRLDVSTDELLSGLRAGSHSPLKRSDADPSCVRINATRHYAVCIVVSECVALWPIDGEPGSSILEATLTRLLRHSRCSRVVMCAMGELFADVEAIVQRSKRACKSKAASTLHLLQGDTDTVASIQFACMYLEATAVASSAPAPLVVVELCTRVFSLRAIDELVHQLGNAMVLTDGLTSAVVLEDPSQSNVRINDTAVGICVCSPSALVQLADSIFQGSEKDEVSETPTVATVHAWIVAVLGALRCEKIIATPAFNWLQVDTSKHPVDGPEEQESVSLVSRFDEDLGQQAEADDDNERTASQAEELTSSTFEILGLETTATSTTLAAIRARLSEDGVEAGLYPIQTKVSYEASAMPVGTRQSTERTPLLGSNTDNNYQSASEATMLSEVDLEEPRRLDPRNAHAFLIQVDRPETDHLATELILALPRDLNDMVDTVADNSSDDDQDEPSDAMLPPISFTRRDRLPSGVTQVTLEAVVEEPSLKYGTATRRVSVVLHIQKQVPLVGYVILITALCAVSSQGAVLDLLVGVPPLLKVFWRMTGASLLFLPFASFNIYRRGFPRLSQHKRKLFVLCILAYTVYNSTFLIALSLTSIGHAYIFGNSHSLIMVAGKLVLGQQLGAMELAGAALGFSGGVVTTLDPGSSSSSSSLDRVVTSSPLGDMVAFCGAFGGVAYLLSAKKLRAVLGVRVFLFSLVTCVWLVLLPVLVLNHARLGITLHEPFHPQRGLLGWVHHLDIEAYIVLVGSVCGTMGFIASMKYFDPLVVSVTMLTEPVVATIISIFVGVERVPGPATVIGGAAVIVGCLLVLLASYNTSTKIDVSDRLIKTPLESAASTMRKERAQAR